MKLTFSKAETTRRKLTNAQRKQIRNLYFNIYADVKNKIEKLKIYDNVSSVAERKMLEDLAKELSDEYTSLAPVLENQIESNMKKVTTEVLKRNAEYVEKLGMNVSGKYFSLNTPIVEKIALGKVYDSNWTLSKAIWKADKKITKDINTIIATGVAEGKSAYEVGKDLEKYVNPNARKDWEWSKVYPGVNKKIDYNAQRLARTMISHAYQQSIVAVTKPNPFVTKLQWLASNSDRTCELCMSRDGKLYNKNELPLDHPNGMCTYVAVIPDNMNQVSDRIADWINGKEDKALDKFSEFLDGKLEPVVTKPKELLINEKEKEEVINKYVQQSNSINLDDENKLKKIIKEDGTIFGDVKLFRKVSVKELGLEKLRQLKENPESIIDKVITPGGFVSTSKTEEGTAGFIGDVMLEIVEVSPKNKGLDISNISGKKNEQEVLFNKGTSYQVISSRIIRDEDGDYITTKIKVKILS